MSPESLNPRNARLYRRRARLSRSLGLAAIPVAAGALIDRGLLGTSSVGVVLDGPVDTVYLIAYLIGGLTAVAGVEWRPHPRPELEALGAWLLAGAMLINGSAIVMLRGPVAGGLTAIGLFALADILVARARDLEQARTRERRRRPHGRIDGPDRRA